MEAQHKITEKISVQNLFFICSKSWLTMDCWKKQLELPEFTRQLTGQPLTTLIIKHSLISFTLHLLVLRPLISSDSTEMFCSTTVLIIRLKPLMGNLYFRQLSMAQEPQLGICSVVAAASIQGLYAHHHHALHSNATLKNIYFSGCFLWKTDHVIFPFELPTIKLPFCWSLNMVLYRS